MRAKNFCDKGRGDLVMMSAADLSMSIVESQSFGLRVKIMQVDDNTYLAP